MVGIRLTDRDLDMPQKRIIVPDVPTTARLSTTTVTVTIEEGDTTIMLPWATYGFNPQAFDPGRRPRP